MQLFAEFVSAICSENVEFCGGESTFLSVSVCAGAADLNIEVISTKCTNQMFYKSSVSACSGFIIN